MSNFSSWRVAKLNKRVGLKEKERMPDDVNI